MKKFSSLLRVNAIAACCCVLVACDSGSGATDGGTDGPAANSAPVISGTPPTSITAELAFEFQPTAYDPDGDTLTFSMKNRPEWATFSPITGRFAGTPPATAQPDYANIEIGVSDGTYTTYLPTFDLTVDGRPNTAPVITGTPATTVVTGNTYEFRPSASDADGQALEFTVANLPAWAQFDTVTGRLWGTPAASHIGVFRAVVISVSDGVVSVSLPAFDIGVTGGAAPPPANRAPTISGTPAGAVTVGQNYLFRPQANDPDGQSLTFSIVNRPGWASFNVGTGELSGTPGVAQVGQATGIAISVSDGQATTALPTFSITVLASNRPPQINGTPLTSVTAGQAYSFTPTASDPDGQTLTFAIANKPAWGSFNSSTGRLSGTPTTAHVGTTSNISISASDGAAQVSLPLFSIQVTSANRPPVISGTPPTTATAGQAYSFTPTASDPDGQTLTFTIANRPAWATFSSSTGQLSGSPSSVFIGSYPDIVITVSDGTATASLPSFAITLRDVTLGSATLRWEAPIQNVDGTPISNLGGFKVHYGTSATSLATVLQIPSPNITEATIEELTPATWYFGITAYNTLGVESAMSEIRSKTIR